MKLRLFFLLLYFPLMGLYATAANLYSRADGTWSLTNGGADCGCTPGQNDNIFVNHDIALAGDFTVKGDLLIDNGASMTINGSGNLVVDGTGTLTIVNNSGLTVNNDLEFKNGSTIDVEDGSTLSVGGDLTNRNNSDNVTFDGDVSVTGDLNNGVGGDISGTGSLDVGGTVTNNGTIGGSTGNDVGSLPVELLYFRGSADNGQVVLQWATEWEENFAYFTIERSVDGTTFSAIGTRDGLGAPTLGRAYDFTDPAPFQGRAYYRLKATDHDGFEEYHGTITVEALGATATLSPYPNPVTNQSFSLRTNFELDGTGTVRLINLHGETVWEAPASSNGQYTLPSSIQAGSYLLRFQQGAHQLISRLAIH